MKIEFMCNAQPVKTKIMFLIDHDGCIADTNSVKDDKLGAFTRNFFYKNYSLKNTDATDENLNKIHHDMYGQPMGNIFKAIAEKYYESIVAQNSEELKENPSFKITGAEVTNALNEYIKDYYGSRPEFPNATKLLSALSAIGTCYIVTGMETDLIAQSLNNKDWIKFFENKDGKLRIYGAEGGPYSPGESVSKSKNIATIQQENGNSKDISYISFGDANSERVSSLNAGATFFKVCHPGQKLASQWVNEPQNEISKSIDDLFLVIRKKVSPLLTKEKLKIFNEAYGKITTDSSLIKSKTNNVKINSPQ